MELMLLFVVTSLASLLTFFSGFGLGTVLLPVFALFFPVDLAIFYVAIIHFLSNLYKAFLLRHAVSYITVIQFGGPAMLGSVVGAYSLSLISGSNVAIHYAWGQLVGAITPLKLAVGLLLMLVALNEFFTVVKVKAKGSIVTLIGGGISGFFGGLAGLQGAFRSYFLVKQSDDKYRFLATSGAIAALVDAVRLAIYSFVLDERFVISGHAFAAVLAALLATYAGARLLVKVTATAIHRLVAIFLLVMGVLLSLGIV